MSFRERWIKRIRLSTLRHALWTLFGLFALCSLLLDGIDLLLLQQFAGGSSPRLELPNWDIPEVKKLFSAKDKGFVPGKDFPHGMHSHGLMPWPKPNTVQVGVKTGPKGFRLHPTPAGKKKGVIKVFGSSNVFGVGVPNTGTIPAFIQQAIPDYLVLNRGIGSFITSQQLMLLTHEIKKGDLIVSYDGHTDVIMRCHLGLDITYMHKYKQMIYNVGTKWLSRRGSYFLEPLVTPFAKVPMRIELLGDASREFYDKDQCDDPSLRRAIIDDAIRYWRMAEAVTRQEGGRFIGILQPVAYFGNNRLDHIDRLSPEVKEALMLPGRPFRKVYPELQKRVRELALPYVYDFTDAYASTKEYVYLDRSHVSSNGNKIVADKIVSIIRKGLSGHDQAGLPAEERIEE